VSQQGLPFATRRASERSPKPHKKFTNFFAAHIGANVRGRSVPEKKMGNWAPFFFGRWRGNAAVARLPFTPLGELWQCGFFLKCEYEMLPKLFIAADLEQRPPRSSAAAAWHGL
jgi:hypothetical protein